MADYSAPLRDTLFNLDQVLKLGDRAGQPGFEALDADMIEPILTEAGKFASEVFAPLNASGDRQGCTRHDDGSVTVPDGFADAYRQMCEGGWTTLTAPETYGGQALPHAIGVAVEEFLSGANMSLAMYPGLTDGAIRAVVARGSDEQKATYLAKLTSGEWTGTMNLTEPHAGTDLGLLRSRAEPNGDGSYAVSGTKIFISCGEHDMASNIVHLVLARLPDAPKGSKGISMFIVPKFLPDENGEPGERNSLSCGSIEEKMGIHGSCTCVMNYDGAKGWLIGGEHQGLAAMFIMMNAARLWVGLQGLGQAEVAYQNGASYALDRRQGRALTGPVEPDQSADLLVVHPDVRRLLMDARAKTEGLRALILWTGLLTDLSHQAATEEERTQADDLIQLLTPVVKAVGTDIGYDVSTQMQQVWGGHGYVAENGMEQFVRDARIAMIYEGANGIQAMDLVGRKLPMKGGRAIQSFFALVDGEIADAASDGAVREIAEALGKANGELKAAAMWLMQNAPENPDNAGSAAYAIMEILGLVAIGLMWLRMANAASAAIEAGEGDKAFMEAKLLCARHFAQSELPDVGALRRKLQAGAEVIMAMPAESFLRA